MPYITVMQSSKTHQITFEDILFDRVAGRPQPVDPTNGTGTYTVFIDRQETIDRYLKKVNIRQLIATLKMFNTVHADLFEVDRNKLYHKFFIPKKSGGYREINEPLPNLMEALRQLKAILEERFGVLYHTSAYAYIKGRCTIDAVKKHQMNKSNWFLKTDFSDFFGSTNEDFLWHMLTMIFPFSEVVKYEDGAAALKKALSLCFLNGGLPQGTPISPLLTNVLMIPIDHRITNDLVKKGFTITRYADDMLISHRQSFDYREVCKYIEGVLARFNAPFRLKDKKTRYGSSAGRNWNLGVMLNKDNKITIGRKNKEYLKSACSNYIRDKRNNTPWELHDILVLSGKISYYKMVEPDYIEQFIKWFNEKNHVNLIKMLRDETR